MPASFTILPSAFFDRDPRRVARALLGKLLIRKTRGGIMAGRIVETEAYLGTGDLAAHAVAGKTARNYVLFGPPGFAYVYFIYGNHYCLNVSCLPDGVAGGVLFRALEPVAGIEKMAEARGIPPPADDRSEAEEPGAKIRNERKKLAYLRNICSGPGRMSEALGVTRERDNGKNMASARSDLQIVDDGYRVRRVAVGPRVGITKSAAEPLRYVIAENPFVSAPALKK
jgi:DNA-3-methyladenine glycosylase